MRCNDLSSLPFGYPVVIRKTVGKPTTRWRQDGGDHERRNEMHTQAQLRSRAYDHLSAADLAFAGGVIGPVAGVGGILFGGYLSQRVIRCSRCTPEDADFF